METPGALGINAKLIKGAQKRNATGAKLEPYTLRGSR